MGMKEPFGVFSMLVLSEAGLNWFDGLDLYYISCDAMGVVESWCGRKWGGVAHRFLNTNTLNCISCANLRYILVKNRKLTKNLYDIMYLLSE